MAGYHVVSEGENLTLIARKYGLSSYRKIWNHPENGDLREKRGTPNLLCPGDQVYVPDTESADPQANGQDNQDQKSSIQAASDGGVSGKHADTSVDGLQYVVGTATSAECNTIRLPLVSVACWRVDDIRFAFNSSFVTADVAAELAMLVRLRNEHQDKDGHYPPLSVFGHADPTGSDDYNKSLSGRRATAVYAILISQTQSGKAVSLWKQIAAAENWGEDQRGAMRDFTGLPAGTADASLIQAYLAKLCPPDLKLAPADFLAQGVDAVGKGDYQGCSRFNPLLIFSQQDEQRYQAAQQDHDQDVLDERNAANGSNRRVVVLLFRPGSKVLPDKWPCPRASEGVAGCIKRFWSNGEARRSKHLADERRYEKTHDTFACRFYDIVSARSPCDQHIVYDEYPFSM